MNLASVAAKNVLRNKFRAVLTVMGVAVAVLTFMMLRTVISAWTAGAEYAAKDRVVTRNKVTFVMPLPKRYVDQVRSAPHIKLTTYSNWFGGKDPKHDREFFAAFAVDHTTYFQVYDDILVPKDQLDTFNHDPQGAIVGDQLAKKLGWKLGDKVFLASGIYPREGDWEFHIDGIYTSKSKAIDRNSFMFRWDYLANDPVAARRSLGRDSTVGWIVSRVDDPKSSADVSVALDKLFDDQEIQTESQDEHAFNQSFLASFSAVLTAIDIISIVILAIMALILGNTIAMGVRERTNEYGVLRAIGFTGGHLVVFILGESVLLALAGGALGILLAYPFINNGMGKWLEENMGNFFPNFSIEPNVTTSAILASILLGVGAAAIPAYRASKLKVVDALRRVA
jgi:putative ABC transport system permease protein